MKKVALVGGGMTKFGKREATYEDLISEAGKATFDSVANVSPGDIDVLLVSSSMPERFAFQTHVATLVADCLGLEPKLLARVEQLCSSGSVAIRLAYSAIAAGLANTALVLGVEKMILPDMTESLLHMVTAMSGWDRAHGITAPGVFALIAQRHMREYGTTEKQLALVSVKNHKNSCLNPYAQFQKPATLEKVLESKPVVPPLKLFDCSALTDGAAGVILASEDKSKEITDTPIYLIGSAQAVKGFDLPTITETTWHTLRKAAKDAYRMAKINPADVDVAETHDCFSISEIIEYEDLGFTEKGKGGKFIEDGQSQIGGKLPVNPDGGLLGRGHPLGATGIAQVLEIFHQLRGEAGKRQVNGAEIGLTHNMSGAIAQQIVMIFKRGD